MSPWLTVVGIGEDGFKGLGKNARRALLGASRIIGGQRQLDLLPVFIRGERQLWPSPFTLEPLLALRGEPVCVLASGDPRVCEGPLVVQEAPTRMPPLLEGGKRGGGLIG